MGAAMDRIVSGEISRIKTRLDELISELSDLESQAALTADSNQDQILLQSIHHRRETLSAVADVLRPLLGDDPAIPKA